MSRCSVCGGPMRSFLGPLELPVFCNVLHADAAAARAAQTGALELGICETCGMISNLRFEEPLAAYGSGYENALHYSAVFREFAEETAERLVERYGVHAGRVVEVGCGDGYFLELLCAAGGNEGLGYDPSRPDGEFEAGNGGRYRIVSQPYGPGSASGEADLLCARHVLEHIAAPHDFIRALRQASGGAVLYIELPDAEYMLREHAFWDVIYEHCSYFSAPSLAELLSRDGYEVLSIGSGFGGQYLCAESRPVAGSPSGRADRAGVEDMVRLAIEFDGARRAELADWNARLQEMEGRIVLWGAGSKGVTLACQLDRGADIAAAVDVNPRKAGLHLPVTGIPVLAPEALVAAPPDHVLVMNRNYLEEIEASLDALGLQPRLWTV